MKDMPQEIVEIIDTLAGARGTVAVVLGGSKASGTSDAGSDWDIGLYYRDKIDLTALSARGTVYPPGTWGRIMNGGAWLHCGSGRVDVILRDLNQVEYWTQRAEQGEFEVDHLLGYLAGVPTYLLTAELASCRVLYGNLNAVPFPGKLVSAAPSVWRFCRSFSLEYARMHARRGNRVGAAGQVAKAAIEEAHARLCEQAIWVCNEKRILNTAGLANVDRHFDGLPIEQEGLVRWVDQVARKLGVLEGELAPWNIGA